MNKKYLTGLAVVVLITAFSIFSNKDETVIKIGVVAPLKSGATIYGDNLVKGIELAKKDLGDKAAKYEIIVEDDEGNVANSASAAQKLISVDKVAAIVTVTSGTGNAVDKIAKDAGIPHICDCVVTTIAGETTFLYTALPQEESRRWLEEAKARNLSKVFLVVQNQPGANLLADEVKKMASDFGVTIVGEEKVDPATRDFRTMVSKMKLVSADTYMTIVFPPTLDILAKEMTLQQITDFSSNGLLAISSDLSVFEGRWYTDNFLSDDAYQTEFTAAYPNTRFNARTAPHGYDIFNLIVKGHESGNIVEYLKNLKEYDGKVGKAVQAENTNIFTLPIGIWEVREGKTVLVK